ncbi:MAG: DUF2244 domain-containing protein [bacterium]
MNATLTDGDIEFSAALRPHRSLSPRGFALLMGVLGGACLILGGFFLAIGAWPVFGFLGLDVLLVYLAFRRNFADAEVREVVEVTDHEVVLYNARPAQPVSERRFPRAWVRVDLDEDHERELIGSLALVYAGRRTEFASFLGPEERKSLATALKTAVAQPRQVRAAKA